MTAGAHTSRIRTVSSHALGFFANRSNCTGRPPEVRTWSAAESTVRFRVDPASVVLAFLVTTRSTVGGWPKWVNHITVSFLQNRKSSIESVCVLTISSCPNICHYSVGRTVRKYTIGNDYNRLTFPIPRKGRHFAAVFWPWERSTIARSR